MPRFPVRQAGLAQLLFGTLFHLCNEMEEQPLPDGIASYLHEEKVDLR